MTTSFVVDAHLTYQSGLKVSGLAGEGFSGLIVKATEGISGYTAPPGFEVWAQQATAAGLLFGSYHWLNGRTSGAGQVDRWIDRVGIAGNRAYALDVEDTKSPPSRAVLIGAIERFMKRSGGHPLLVYSGKWWVDRYASWMRDLDLSSLGPVMLWDSHYVSGAGYASQLYGNVPDSWWGQRYGKSSPTLLQFTSTARVGGKSAVDVSAFRGTPAQLRSRLTDSSARVIDREIDMFFATDGTRPDIVATDGATWSVKATSGGGQFPAYAYSEIVSMRDQGIPTVTVSAARLDSILALPEPAIAAAGPAPLDYEQLAKALLDQLAK